MGRKRNQGKARRAATAKVREEVGERGGGNNNPMANNSSEQSLSAAARMRQLQIVEQKCRHGFDPSISTDDVIEFMCAFDSSFINAVGSGGRTIPNCLALAHSATMNEFAAVWEDLAKMEMAMSCLLCTGTQNLLESNYDTARDCATIARFCDHYIAVKLKQTQALYNWPKIDETYHADKHTLVKFFWKRIPCSCLDEKYNEVKQITKMGHCWNPQCSISGRILERSKTKYCSRCRCVTYCSRECQEAHWTDHKSYCDHSALLIANFEAKWQE